MDLTVTQRRENPMFDRTEVYFSIAHPKEGTPTRAQIRRALAASLNTKDRVVILDWARGEYGRTVTLGYAKVYTSKAQALEIETTPILIRNGLKEAPKVTAPPKEAPAPPKKEAEEAAAKAAPPAKPAKEPLKEGPPKKKAKPKPEAKEPAPKKSPRPEAKKEAPKEAVKGKKPPKEKGGK